MDTHAQYREYIQKLMTERANLVWDKRIQAQTIFDTERDHYQLVYVGWRDCDRFYGVILHADIIDGKIWVQRDDTEDGVTNELIAAGIPKDKIVLGFHPADVRQYTGYAVV